MSGTQTRLAAAELLVLTLDDHRTLDEAMVRSALFDELAGSDRGFARAMASAALRHLGRIDQALDPFLDRSLEETSPFVRALLRIGAAQAWILETPSHAVVGETVEAAKRWPAAQRATGFLNAVLRKVVEDRAVFEATDTLNVWPAWLQKDLTEGRGKEAARAIAEAQLTQPELHLTPRDGDADALAARLDGTVIGNGSVQINAANVEALPGYDEGAWWVQDSAAVLPAQLLVPAVGDHVLDICAAPGGKTMQLAAAGAKVTAIDRSKPRLRRLRENIKRTRLDGIDMVSADATGWRPPELTDKILLDAPCSALGTLRRHPEGAWIKSAEDIARFPSIQTRLLEAAIQMLKPGGTLVYCVCSPRPQEGEQIVETVIADKQLFREPVQPADCSDFAASITDKGDLLTLPIANPVREFNHDAFFISRLKKPV